MHEVVSREPARFTDRTEDLGFRDLVPGMVDLVGSKTLTIGDGRPSGKLPGSRYAVPRSPAGAARSRSGIHRLLPDLPEIVRRALRLGCGIQALRSATRYSPPSIQSARG